LNDEILILIRLISKIIRAYIIFIISQIIHPVQRTV